LKIESLERKRPKYRAPGGHFKDSVPWTFFWLTAAGICIGVLSLLFAIGPYGWAIFKSYFRHPLILFLNLAPVVLMIFFFYFLFGRMRAAYTTTVSVIIGLSFANYDLLRLRDDPLMFSDFINIREAFSITAKQKYDLTPDRRMWFGIACVFLGILFISLFVRHRMSMVFSQRVRLALIPAALLTLLGFAMVNTTIYTTKAVNNDGINPWSATQVYLSKGFVYPFFHSLNSETLQRPFGYRKADAEAVLAQYQDTEIPEDRKVSVLTVQLEAFADLSLSGAKGVDWDDAYGTYHQILKNCYHGRLVTNIFAGGTVNTERCFLTGFSQLKNIRSDTNSYAWYFADQGYTVNGSHPSYAWFYNRKNINSYLGFSEYDFYENHYCDLTGGTIADDQVLMREIFRLYQESRSSGAPVFSFNVTYQGHGPYDTESVWRGEHFTDGRYAETSANILDNYLGSVKDTAEQLQTLLQNLNDSGDPVVVVFYGDHKPWLGDSSSVYAELGISLDTSTETGFLNRYSTDYGIWASDAAKSVLGDDFTGTGPDLSSNYLMNELFDLCQWKGSAYMQATEELRKTLPVITSVGRYSDGTGLYSASKLSQTARTALKKYHLIEYYWEKNFVY
jgi:phosphoglycerol transferase MdoB-like AlkP superfamily enzyme